MPLLTPLYTIPGDAPDPMVLRVGDTYYSYSTQVGAQRVPVRSATTLRTWSAPIDVMPSLAKWAVAGRHWAPSVMATGNATWPFVLHYCAHHRDTGFQAIGRAVAKSPLGPFIDGLNVPFVAQTELGGCIDPSVFTDTDGKRYLLWKADANAIGKDSELWIAPLSRDGLTVRLDQARSILKRDREWERPLIEGPEMVKDGLTYFLFYSANWWESERYAIGYATGKSPIGPFTKQSKSGPWYRTTSGPGAPSIFYGKSGKLYVAFHQWYGANSYAAGGQRRLNIGQLALAP